MAEMRVPGETLVVVTGASGFIGLHCVRALLEHGYRVRGTLRDLASASLLRRALAPLEPGDRLEFVRTELLSDAGWSAAFSGVTFVLHVASPLPKASPKDDHELIRPAREGTLRVLRHARDAGVSRVVMTSSVAAVTSGREHDGHVFDESDWSDFAHTKGAYEKSKTLAERAAWDYVQHEARALELVALNPSFVLGPSLTGAENTSNELVNKLLRRELPGVPRLHLPLVDVRDVALAHVLAMTHEKAAGERFILTSDTVWMKEIADTLAAAGYRVPTREVPDFVVRVLAVFDPTARLVVDDLGQTVRLSSDKATRVLGWTGRRMKDMVLDAAARATPHAAE